VFLLLCFTDFKFCNARARLSTLHAVPRLQFSDLNLHLTIFVKSQPADDLALASGQTAALRFGFELHGG
jgi:hypothetical protein